MEDMIKCEVCGEKSPKNSRFCFNCGAMLDEDYQASYREYKEKNAIEYKSPLIEMKVDEPQVKNIEESDEEPVDAEVIVDYFSAVVATIGGDRSSEIVLYKLKDGTEQISTYEKTYSTKEVHKAHKLDKPLSKDIEKIIEEEKLYECVNVPKALMCGGYKIFKFKYKDKLIRLEDGQFNNDAFRRIMELISMQLY